MRMYFHDVLSGVTLGSGEPDGKHLVKGFSLLVEGTRCASGEQVFQLKGG